MNRCIAAACQIIAMALLMAAAAGCTMGDLPMRKGIEDLGMSWNKIAKFPDSGDSVAGYQLGDRVAMSSDTVAISFTNATKVVLYPITGSTTPIHSFTTIDSPTSIAIGEDMLVVGLSSKGKVCVYHCISGSWNDACDTITSPTDSAFGASVSLSGSTLLVGAPLDGATATGLAYIYTYSGGAWSAPYSLKPSDGMGGDLFGSSTSISGSYALVGANAKTVSPTIQAGTAYVFWYNGTYWGYSATYHIENKKITLAVPAMNDSFGQSVCVDSDGVAIVGAPGRNAAFIYRDQGANNWTLEATLIPSGATSTDAFGWSVGLSGDFAAIGSPSGLATKGDAFIAHRQASSWSLEELPAPDGVTGDNYGWSTTILGSYAAIGANQASVGGTSNSGAVYLFRYER